MRKTLLALVVAFSVATVGLAVGVHSDVLDSVTVTLACKNWTIRLAGHGLDHPNAAVHYLWSAPAGSLGVGLTSTGVSDTLSVNPKQDRTFTVSVTRPEPIPPFDNPLFDNMIGFGTATLITGAMTWNTVTVNVTGTFECPSLNKCPLTQNQWRNRQHWPVMRLVLGNPFPDPSPLNYRDAKVRDILRSIDGTDASIELAHQLITAKLNLFNGAPRIVADPASGSPSGNIIFFLVTNDADILLGSGRLPQHVDPTSGLGQQMAADAALLESYNAGALTTQNPDGTCQ